MEFFIVQYAGWGCRVSFELYKNNCLKFQFLLGQLKILQVSLVYKSDSLKMGITALCGYYCCVTDNLWLLNFPSQKGSFSGKYQVFLRLFFEGYVVHLRTYGIGYGIGYATEAVMAAAFKNQRKGFCSIFTQCTVFLMDGLVPSSKQMNKKIIVWQVLLSETTFAIQKCFLLMYLSYSPTH